MKNTEKQIAEIKSQTIGVKERWNFNEETLSGLRQ